MFTYTSFVIIFVFFQLQTYKLKIIHIQKQTNNQKFRMILNKQEEIMC